MNIRESILPQHIDGKRLWRTTRKAEIDSVVIHYISAVNIDKKDPFNIGLILKIFRDYKYSAHYLIMRDGEIWKLVNEENVAYHAGKSKLHGKSVSNSCNDFSIGIELAGGKWIDYTDEQYEALIELLNDIKTRYNINKENIVGHSDIAPERKVDPGNHFDWNKVRDGIFPEKVDVPIDEKLMKERKINDVIVTVAKRDIKKNIQPKENNISNGDISAIEKIICAIVKIFTGRR